MSSAYDEGRPGGSIAPSETRVINGHRVLISRTVRGSAPRKWVTKCVAWCATCGWVGPIYTNNDALDKAIMDHIEQGLAS